MSRVIPLGAPRYRGHTDGILPRKLEGAVVAGVAVSRVEVSASQPTVKPFDGTNFAGFSTHDVDTVRGVGGVIKHGESVCVRAKEGSAFTAGNGFAVDNTTGEVVPAGTADSVQILGDIEEVGVIGLDENCNEIPDCLLVNLYGGVVYSSGGAGGAVTSVNGKTGDVTLAAADVGALPDSYEPPVKSVNGETGEVTLDAAAVGALDDAPSDGKTYARKDAAWAEVPASAAPTPPESDAKTASRAKK
ncbi:phage neck protein fibritin [Vibrio harveyi]|uniref:phage neck protein fibritin n=1 Tax=Vibrio harveyi TaxID=669 RepID=UPI003CFB2F6E